MSILFSASTAVRPPLALEKDDDDDDDALAAAAAAARGAREPSHGGSSGNSEYDAVAFRAEDGKGGDGDGDDDDDDDDVDASVDDDRDPFERYSVKTVAGKPEEEHGLWDLD